MGTKTERDELNGALASADRALDRLIKLLVTDDRSISEDVVFALHRFGDATVIRLTEMLSKAKDPKLRRRVIYLLGASGTLDGEAVIHSLRKVLEEDLDPMTRAVTMNVLGLVLSGMMAQSASQPAG